jgi:hypothetical protein
VWPAAWKEVHFFSIHYNRGPLYYRTNFPLRSELGGSGLTGEATPYYLFHPHAPARVKALVPQSKLIALLRDPIERAYSHYQNNRRYGHEQLSFEDAIAREDRVWPTEVAALAAHPTRYRYHHHHHLYVHRGMYAEQLERWYAHFERSQLLVLRSEDLFADPASVYQTVLDFLGLPPFRPTVFGNHNPSTGPAIPAAARSLLAGRFDESNARLERLVGREMRWTR